MRRLASPPRWHLQRKTGTSKSTRPKAAGCRWTFPDGKRIIFDLLGDIYSIPSTGGEAIRLTPVPKLVSGKSAAPDDTPSGGQPFDVQPRFSPDGKKIVFVSDRDGSDNIYIMNQDGSGLRQLSKAEGKAKKLWPDEQ